MAVTAEDRKKTAAQTEAAPRDEGTAFRSDYDGEIGGLYRQISSRGPFTYDAAADPLYGQYRERYAQEGRQAMRDAMGQAAALTGGYGSSYGQAVGQQQYDAYLRRLNEVLPELYRTALDRWDAEGDRLTQRLQLAGQLRQNEYAQYRDAVGDRQTADARAVQEAEGRAQYGDFGGYAALYGEETARSMMMTWAQANPDAAYFNGSITPEEYRNFTGRWPRGSGHDGGGGEGDPWAYGGSGWNDGNYYTAHGLPDPRKR